MMIARSRTKWMGLAAVMVLLAGLGLAVTQWRPPPVRAPSAPDLPLTPADTLDDRLIDRALGPGEGDDKTRWIDEIPGVDVAGLDSTRRAIFLRHANTQQCDCSCGYTLAACRVYDSSCEESEPRVLALRDSVRRGEIRGATGLREPPR
jgi:hypothetical protein